MHSHQIDSNSNQQHSFMHKMVPHVLCALSLASTTFFVFLFYFLYDVFLKINADFTAKLAITFIGLVAFGCVLGALYVMKEIIRTCYLKKHQQ